MAFDNDRHVPSYRPLALPYVFADYTLCDTLHDLNTGTLTVRKQKVVETRTSVKSESKFRKLIFTVDLGFWLCLPQLSWPGTWAVLMIILLYHT